MLVLSLFSLLFAIAVAQAQVASQTPATRNATYYSNDPSFVYIQSCVPDNPSDCQGAWWTEYDPKYGNGRVKVTGDPSVLFRNGQSVFSFTFEGTGFYVYQWVNKTSAAQTRVLDGKSEDMNFVEGTNWPYPVNDEATLTMTWSQTGLAPGKHTIELKHNKVPEYEGFLVLDHIVVEDLLQDLPSKPNKGRIIGGSVGGAILLLAIIGLYFLYRREQANRARRKAEAKLASLRDNGPSAEIQASEKLYAEAKKEELQMQPLGKSKAQDSLSRSDSPV
ncbi:hypothetical protein FRC02_006011 [Tulasnella sp. 418]|nr:hypothetical protein FRC02_006011 [Tulasnella sp. 418]